MKNVNSNPVTKPKTNPNNAYQNTGSLRAVQQGKQAIKQSAASTYYSQAVGGERDAQAVEGDVFASKEEAKPEDTKQQNKKQFDVVKAKSSEHAELVRQKHMEANKQAESLMQQMLYEKIADVKKAFDSKEGPKNEQLKQQLDNLEKNIGKTLDNPEQIMKVLRNTVPDILTKLKEEAEASEDTELADEVSKADALFNEIVSIMDSDDPHLNLLDMVDFKLSKGSLTDEVKEKIKSHKNALEAVADARRREVEDLEKLENHPLFIKNVGVRGDKSWRNYLAQLGGLMTDDKGGIFDFADTEVTWYVTPFEQWPDDFGRGTASFPIRRLLNTSGKHKIMNDSSYTNQLTEAQPIYDFMTQV